MRLSSLNRKSMARFLKHGFRQLAEWAGWLLLLVVVWTLLGGQTQQLVQPDVPAADRDVREALREFSEVVNLVDQNYAETINPDKAIYNGAIPGMLRVLDPHSNFFDTKAYGALREEQTGRYFGVGMTIAPRNNKVIVLARLWEPRLTAPASARAT